MRASLLPLAIVMMLAGALILVGVLQYRWISRLSRSERERLEANLSADGDRFCDDVDREISRAWEAFQVAPPQFEGDLTSKIVTRLARWRATAPYPRLVSRLYLVRQLPRGELELGCLDERGARFEACPMTADLASVAEMFGDRGRIRRLDPLLPGLVIPVRNPPDPSERTEPGDPPPPPVRQHVVVRFETAVLTRELLARFAAARFGVGAGASSVDVAVAGPAAEPFFHFGPDLSTTQPRADVTRRLFLVRAFADVPRDAAGRRGTPPRRAPESEAGETRGRTPASRERIESGEARPGTGEAEEGGWILSLRYPAGGLDAAVAAARRKNLLLSSGVLALLAAAACVLLVSTQRARTLARQQLAFVAGISHELRTPLTVIRSAAQNLAADAVTEPAQVRRYGEMIETEGRRLTELVSRVLAFARIRSGEQLYHFRPVVLAPLLEEVAASFATAVDQAGLRLELRVPTDLPPVLADPGALRHLFANLVDNAIKYGGSGGRIDVTAERKDRNGKHAVEVRVSDRGRGIRRGDRKRIFDPFFRDADVSASPVPGSGLGLALVRHIVEAHGGSIRVESAIGLGSTFLVELPAAAPTSPPEEESS